MHITPALLIPLGTVLRRGGAGDAATSAGDPGTACGQIKLDDVTGCSTGWGALQGNHDMPPSTKGKVDTYFGVGFLLNDSERGLREVGMKIKMSGTAPAKNRKSVRVLTALTTA